MSIDYSYTQNRELSWLKFNRRVLEEAIDEDVPLLECLKFISIFSSNFTEFFMVRCGMLYDLSLIDSTIIDNKTGLTAKQQLDEIFLRSRELYKLKDEIYSEVSLKLAKFKIMEVSFDELTDYEAQYIDTYFRETIKPILKPNIINNFQVFKNNTLNIICMLDNDDFGFIQLPDSLKRIIFLPSDGFRYILLENIILHYLDEFFKSNVIKFKTVFMVTYKADISFIQTPLDIEKLPNYSNKLPPISIQFYKKKNQEVVDFLTGILDTSKNHVLISESPLNMDYVYYLLKYIKTRDVNLFEKLSYKAFVSNKPPNFNLNKSIIGQLLKEDYLFFYPYESMDLFLCLLKEASNDKNVESIRITIYRLADNSKVIEYLLDALNNGIEVTALIELRARFDEENNLKYADILENAGAKVIYGLDKYKVHSKICLITLKTSDYITQLGTGNYNEKTAKIYTDLSYMTSRKDIGEDGVLFFKNMESNSYEDNYKKLIVSPTSFKSTIIRKIKEQIEIAKSSRPALIIMKMNSLTDRDLIDMLQKASKAGVVIKLIIRGICCIIPGIPNVTDNIRIISIVGRFLEHSRIYCFGVGNDCEIYLSSADLMTRNTERRVEIGFPIEDRIIKARILNMINVMLSDNVKAREIDVNGDMVKIPVISNQINSQNFFIENLFYDKLLNEKHIQESLFSKLKHLSDD